jgi:hypothetical protein
MTVHWSEFTAFECNASSRFPWTMMLRKFMHCHSVALVPSLFSD